MYKHTITTTSEIYTLQTEDKVRVYTQNGIIGIEDNKGVSLFITSKDFLEVMELNKREDAKSVIQNIQIDGKQKAEEVIRAMEKATKTLFTDL